ncbi:MAG: DUF2961 domain-containing protein [Clostridia bacterium]|nr:DUF2961 domain-containing protein [Clostridia bacterium]
MHYSYVDIAKRMIDPKFLATKGGGEVTKEFTSYDRASRLEDGKYIEWDANGDGGHWIRDLEDGGALVAEMDGPGYISRIWSATSGPGRFKIYIDGGEEPVIDLPFNDYFNCASEPFTYPALCYEAAMGKNCFVPITYNKSCRIVAYGGFGDDGWGKYYHVNYTTFPEGTTVESTLSAEFPAENKAILARINELFTKNCGKHPEGLEDAPFESFTVTGNAPAVKTFDGKGALYGILARVHYTTFDHQLETIELLKDLRIKIYWNGSDKADVNAPLGDFFATCYGMSMVRTYLLGTRNDKTFYNYFYMPYLDGAKIEIYTVGKDADIELSVNSVALEGDGALRYCALFNRGEYIEDKTRHPDYSFLRVKGEGRLAAVALHMSKLADRTDPASAPGNYWWGEGDEKIYVDGEKFPSWFGTGTEDFFGYAWCSPIIFNRAFHAQPYCVGRSFFKGNRSLVRIFTGDSIAFNESFDGYLEKYYGPEYTQYGFTTHVYLSDDSVVEDIIYDDEKPLDYYLIEADAIADSFTEGEHLNILAVNSEKGIATSQLMAYEFGPEWSNDLQLFCRRFAEGEGFKAALPAKHDGEHVLIASFTRAKDYGIISCTVNGKAVGEAIDLYSENVNANTLTELGRVEVKAGFANEIEFTVKGKNELSAGLAFGIDFLLLVPADEYRGLDKLDLSAYTDVYRADTAHKTQKEIYVRCEDLHPCAYRTAGHAYPQPTSILGEGWKTGMHLLYANPGEGSVLHLPFMAEAAGEYHATMTLSCTVNYGIFEIALNGDAICTVDLYSESGKPLTVYLDKVQVKAGTNRFTLTCKGKNEQSSGYCAGVEAFTLTLTE